jgi:hypothetical protein
VRITLILCYTKSLPGGFHDKLTNVQRGNKSTKAVSSQRNCCLNRRGRGRPLFEELARTGPFAAVARRVAHRRMALEFGLVRGYKPKR